MTLIKDSVSKERILLIRVANTARIRYNFSGIYPVFPLGIAYLASYLRRAGYSTILYDLDLPAHRRLDLIQFIKDNNVSLIGLSATVISLPETNLLSRKIKETFPQIPIVLGGPATIYEPEVILGRIPWLDFVISGEGEMSLLKLVETFDERTSLSEVPSLAYRTDGKVVVNPLAEPLDLDFLPFPARDLLPHNKYRMHPPFNIYHPIALMETARGCNYYCNFCKLPRPARYRSIPNVLDEIDFLISTYSTKEIHFIDPTFTDDRNRIIEFCESLLKKDYKLHWTFKTRADKVDIELLELCKKAGCYMISYGIESGSQKMLDAMSKGYTEEDVYNALKFTKDAGIRSLAYILYGLPGEDDKTVAKTIKLLKDTKPDFALFAGIFPCPGSDITERFIEKDVSWRKKIEDYYFERIPLKGEFTLFGLPTKKVRWWIIKSFIKFYLTPASIFRRLFNLRSARDFFIMFKGGMFLLRDLFFSGKRLEDSTPK